MKNVRIYRTRWVNGKPKMAVPTMVTKKFADLALKKNNIKNKGNFGTVDDFQPYFKIEETKVESKGQTSKAPSKEVEVKITEIDPNEAIVDVVPEVEEKPKRLRKKTTDTTE
jgi:hypothetical protein